MKVFACQTSPRCSKKKKKKIMSLKKKRGSRKKTQAAGKSSRRAIDRLGYRGREKKPPVGQSSRSTDDGHVSIDVSAQMLLPQTSGTVLFQSSVLSS
jgi:hypothetical protein